MPSRPIAFMAVLALAPDGARAQDAGAQAAGLQGPGDVLMASDSFLEAGVAYRAAFDETHDPTFLGKAAKAYMKLGPEGRAQALDAATLYTRHARTIDEARESQAILAEVQAMPDPGPPPTPPPAPVVIEPTPAPTAPPAGPTDPDNPAVWDVLYLVDGSIVRGVIVSQNSREYAVALPGGSVVVVPVENVREIRREPNRDYEPRVVESEAGEVKAESGFRFGAASGVAVPVGDFNDRMNASFEVAARVGWEFIVSQGQVGLSPAARAEYIRWANDGNGTYDFLHIGVDLRLAGHFGRVIPYLSVCAGGDLNYVEADDVFDAPALADVASGKGFGLDVGLGMDILLTRRAAVGFGVRYHPGFTDVIDLAAADSNTSFLAFQGGFAIY